MDLHYSQTLNRLILIAQLFESPMDLHYSQTFNIERASYTCLNPLWIYTTLKLDSGADTGTSGLNPLWIYTTLKQEGGRRYAITV